MVPTEKSRVGTNESQSWTRSYWAYNINKWNGKLI